MTICSSSTEGKLVIVTGGGRGIGRAVAIASANEGYRVILIARSSVDLAETRRMIESTNGRAESFVCDVADRTQVGETLQKIIKENGPVYGLVCAAGIYGPIGMAENASVEEWEKCIEVNLFGAFRCISAVTVGMKAQGEGRIVLFAGGGEGAMPGFSAYVSSKGAITRLTETLGSELLSFSVYVNAIAPGPVNTRLLDELIAAGPLQVGVDRFRTALKQKQDGGVAAEKSAKLALYLLSKASSGLSGRILSAVWDKYEDFRDPSILTATDLYTFRRVVDSGGGTRPK